ncbi:hypothetical protein FIBSPDRAFT_732279, partial [Athelia psychrophila]
LQKALRRSEALVEYQCSRMIQMQASTVLTQLENQEKKKGKGKDKNKRLHGDGMPRLLTSDEFYAVVEQATEQREKDAAAKEARSDQMEKYKRDLARWKTQEDAKAARNEAKTEAWRKAVADFKAGKELAKERNERWNGGKQQVRGPL